MDVVEYAVGHGVVPIARRLATDSVGGPTVDMREKQFDCFKHSLAQGLAHARLEEQGG